MAKYEVTLGKGGSGTFKTELHASTPDEARKAAEHQNTAQAVRRMPG